MVLDSVKDHIRDLHMRLSSPAPRRMLWGLSTQSSMRVLNVHNVLGYLRLRFAPRCRRWVEAVPGCGAGFELWREVFEVLTPR